MKKQAILLLLLGVWACQQKPAETDSTMIKNPEMVGNDTNEHGCKASAGYTWSVLKNDCVRLFEEGLRLNSPDSTQTLSAFVIFSSDGHKAELFFPDTTKPLIIKQKNENLWANKAYILYKEDRTYSIKKGKDILYQNSF